jgi:hypothetical protein
MALGEDVSLEPHSHGDVVNFLREVREAVDSGVLLGESAKLPTHDAFILGMYWRSRALLEAVDALLQVRLPDEALIIWRSLFEQSLRLQELGNSGSSRVALLLAWYNAALSAKSGLIKGAERRGWAAVLGLDQSQIEDKRGEIQGYMARHNVPRLSGFMTDEAASAKFDRDDELWVMRLTGEIVHGSEVAHGSRRRALEDGGVGYDLRDNDPERAAWVAALAGRSMLLIRQAVGPIFGWPQAALCEALVGRIDGFLNGRNRLVPNDVKGKRAASDPRVTDRVTDLGHNSRSKPGGR